WGLLWGVFVFGELQGRGTSLYAQVIGGSLIMAAGATAIAFSSAPPEEHERWQTAAFRESDRYGTDPEYGRAGLGGRSQSPVSRRTALDWAKLSIATLAFVALAALARPQMISSSRSAAAALLVMIVGILLFCVAALWRTTKFN